MQEKESCKQDKSLQMIKIMFFFCLCYTYLVHSQNHAILLYGMKGS